MPGKRLLPTEFGQQEGKVSRHVEWVTKSRGDSWFPSAGKLHWDRQMASLRWRTSGCPQAGREKPSPRHLHIYFLFVSPEIFCELIQEALDPFQTGGAVSNTIWTGLQGSSLFFITRLWIKLMLSLMYLSYFYPFVLSLLIFRFR